MHGLLALPTEILRFLAEHLEVSALSQLRVTCRKAASVLRPVLLTNIRLLSQHSAKSLLEVLIRDPSLSNEIVSLTFQYPSNVCAEADATTLLPELPRLQRVKLSSGPSRDEQVPSNDLELTYENIGFLSLFQTPNDRKSAPTQSELPPGLQSVSFDCVDGSAPWNIEEKIPLLTHPRLTSLTLRSMYASNDNHSNLYAEQQQQAQNSPPTCALRELRMLVCQVEPAAFEQILRFPPALTTLDFGYHELDDDFSSYPNTLLEDSVVYFRAIERHASTLQRLRIQGVQTSPDDPHQPCFTHFPRLRTLVATFEFFGTNSEQCDSVDWCSLVRPDIQEFTLEPFAGVWKFGRLRLPIGDATMELLVSVDGKKCFLEQQPD